VHGKNNADESINEHLKRKKKWRRRNGATSQPTRPYTMVTGNQVSMDTESASITMENILK
jgi:hypothetical protein